MRAEVMRWITEATNSGANAPLWMSTRRERPRGTRAPGAISFFATSARAPLRGCEEIQGGPACERDHVRCEARRRVDAGTSWRRRNEADGVVPPQDGSLWIFSQPLGTAADAPRFLPAPSLSICSPAQKGAEPCHSFAGRSSLLCCLSQPSPRRKPFPRHCSRG